MEEVICKEVVITTLTIRGNGTEDDPIRRITEIYEKDGTKIAEHDPEPKEFSKADIIKFAKYVKLNVPKSDEINYSILEQWMDFNSRT